MILSSALSLRSSLACTSLSDLRKTLDVFLALEFFVLVFIIIFGTVLYVRDSDVLFSLGWPDAS
jgi:hypothetical protein